MPSVPDDPTDAKRLLRDLWRKNDARLEWSEDEWLDNLIGRDGLATFLGWEVVHFRPARTKHGWKTPVQGSLGKGWPDLILARPPRILAVELKSDNGKVSEEQRRVLAVLAACGIETAVWRPRDLEVVAHILR